MGFNVQGVPRRKAQNAWDNFRIQLRYAKEADEKAAMYLRWAAGK